MQWSFTWYEFVPSDQLVEGGDGIKDGFEKPN
jgi:hypothetical protein